MAAKAAGLSGWRRLSEEAYPGYFPAASKGFHTRHGGKQA